MYEFQRFAATGDDMDDDRAPGAGMLIEIPDGEEKPPEVRNSSNFILCNVFVMLCNDNVM